MIYDKLLTVCVPPNGWAKPADGRLTAGAMHYYAELTVYHRRFWEAQAAGTRADKMLQIPMGYDVLPTWYVALPGDPHLYRIEEAQYTKDDDGLPATNLTLRRMEAFYDLCKPAGCT